MFNKSFKGMRRHKYTIISISIVILFSLLNFFWLIYTGDYFVVRDYKALLFVFFLVRCAVYVAIFVFVERRLKGKSRKFFGTLLALLFFVYEFFIVFNIPNILYKWMGF